MNDFQAQVSARSRETEARPTKMSVGRHMARISRKFFPPGTIYRVIRPGRPAVALGRSRPAGAHTCRGRLLRAKDLRDVGEWKRRPRQPILMQACCLER